MTVYFNKKRQRWCYDFERNRKRYFGYCYTDNGEPATSYQQASDYQETIRAEIPTRGRVPLRPDNSYVYFLATADKRRVKIGHSRTPTKRIRNLQIGSSVKLTLLGKLTGSQAIERALHEKFEHHHIHGEWYRLEPEITDFIERNCRPERHTSAPDKSTRTKGAIQITV